MKHLMKQLLSITFFGILSMLSIATYSQSKGNLKVLFVVTSHDRLGETGEKTGVWIEEFATPYYFLKDKGIELVISSPKGGQVPIDPKSNLPDFQTEATKRYYADAA